MLNFVIFNDKAHLDELWGKRQITFLFQLLLDREVMMVTVAGLPSSLKLKVIKWLCYVLWLPWLRMQTSNWAFDLMVNKLSNVLGIWVLPLVMAPECRFASLGAEDAGPSIWVPSTQMRDLDRVSRSFLEHPRCREPLRGDFALGHFLFLLLFLAVFLPPE